MTDDKRQFPRVPVSLTVAYPSAGDFVRDLATDLSPGGLFIRTSKPLPIGTEIDLKVVIPNQELTLSVRGRVVWLKDHQGIAEGMGIHFTGVMGPVLAEMVESAKKG